MWSVRVGRQGITCAGWKQLLGIAIVLAAPVSFQAGLLWVFLEYNDKRSMLGGCTMVAFSPPLPLRSEGASVSAMGLTKKLRNHHFGAHTLERALFAYADTRKTAAQKAATRAVKGKLGFRSLFRRPTEQDAVADDKADATVRQVVTVANFITLPATEGDTCCRDMGHQRGRR